MSPLEILGLSPGSSLEEAKARWRQLVQQHHPDHASTDDTQKFHDIQAAYEAVKADPSILDGKKASTASFLRVDVDVSIEDIYFYREIPIKITRQVYCDHCSGTGAEAREAGICTLCNGTGKITSNVLKLMGRDSTCPTCSGAGVSSKNRCTVCGGSKYVIDRSTRKMRFSINDYHKKIVTLKDAGHQISRNTYGSVYVKLNVDHSGPACIEDDYFRVNYKILPIQRIIGDSAEMEMYSRVLRFKIEKNATETLIVDRVSPGVTQRVRVMFIETPATLTDETVELYEKILAIEKQYKVLSRF
jgi:DnaJ-class molecular chaperone